MILACQNINKAFGTNVILKDASFHIEEKEKAAIVGINGAGKSTLLKIIMKQIPADSGEVILAKDRTIGYLAQHEAVSSGNTIYEELLEVKQDIFELERHIRTLELQMKSQSGGELEQTLELYNRLNTEFEQKHGYACKSEIVGVLKGLGFTEDEFSKQVDTLSGGQKTRVALGKLLLAKPDLILLDEPTNHLDMQSIAWLENFLINYSGAVIIVAHDRYFLNRVVSKVIEIKHQQEVIDKLKSFNREKSIKRAESREKMLEKMEVLDRPDTEVQELKLSLEPRFPSGNDVLRVEGLAKSFGDHTLFTDLDFEIKRGERVALIGNNGTGKTTILKIINELLAADAGSFTLGSKVCIGYYDQEHHVLHMEKTLFEEISDDYPTLTNTEIRNVLAAFLFTGDDVFKRISDLSGGERGRVSLAKLMLSEANFLILDEPTNHLDILSKEILEQALNRYTGTVFYVSHDRYFINQTATRILELTGNTLVNYIGNYDYYLEKKDELTKIYVPSATEEETASLPSSSAETAGKLTWQQQKEEQARIRKRQNELKKTEDRIHVLEVRDKEIDELMMQEEVFTNVAKCVELNKEKTAINEELEQLYERWEELAE